MQHNRLQLAAAIGGLCKGSQPSHSIALNVNRLAQIGRSLRRLAEKQCNDPGWSERDEKRRSSLVSDASAIADFYGLRISTSNDPRGYCLKVVGLGINNTWGEDGFGVE